MFRKALKARCHLKIILIVIEDILTVDTSKHDVIDTCSASTQKCSQNRPLVTLKMLTEPSPGHPWHSPVALRKQNYMKFAATLPPMAGTY